MEERNETLASEIYGDLKAEIRFKNKLIIGLIAIVVGLALALTGTNLYHIYQWSQFDTYVVDSGDYGNSNLVQGDNGGGIYNATDQSAAAERQQGQENPG